MIEKKCKTCHWNTQRPPKPCYLSAPDGKVKFNCGGHKNWEPCTHGDLIRGLEDEDLAIVIAWGSCTREWTTNQIRAWLGSRFNPDKPWDFEEAGNANIQRQAIEAV